MPQYTVHVQGGSKTSELKTFEICEKMSKTFEIFEIYDFDPVAKTFEVFPKIRHSKTFEVLPDRVFNSFQKESHFSVKVKQKIHLLVELNYT